MSKVTAVALPPQSQITHAYASVNLADAYAVDLPPGASTDPETLARYIFSRQPAWAAALMTLRDAIVAGLGLKTAKQLTSPSTGDQVRRIGIFKIYSTSPTEIVMGEDDKHLDFRLSLMCSPATSDSSVRRVVLSTVVHCHNRLGRAYIFVIAPFHRQVVKAFLRGAAQGDWPDRP
jgi:hypothetical protein